MQQVDKNNIDKLAKRIKDLRLKQSKSLNKFVFANAPLTSATWSRLENGLFDFKISTIIKASSMLGITLDELIKDIDFNYDFYE